MEKIGDLGRGKKTYDDITFEVYIGSIKEKKKIAPFNKRRKMDDPERGPVIRHKNMHSQIHPIQFPKKWQNLP